MAIKKITALALLGILTLTATGCESSSSTPSSVKSSPARAGVPSLVGSDSKDHPDWPQLTKAMNSDPASIVAPQALKLAGGADEFRRAFVKGTTFTVDEKSWVYDNGSGAVIIREHTPSGIVIDNYTIMLEDVNQHWWITNTLTLAEAEDAGLYKP